MGKVNAAAKDEIIKLMMQEFSTEEIAEKTNYSIGTIRQVFEELRGEYGVKSKMGIATTFMVQELLRVKSQINKILNIISNDSTITTKQKYRNNKRSKIWTKSTKENY